jgi:uncharacterized protein YbjT (DUF2867 family)
MNCFVTGGSGFIGANLIHELVARGHRVKALLRPNSDRRGLAGADYEVVEGDVLDQASLERGIKGCEWCFHVAASYHLWLRDYRPMYRKCGRHAPRADGGGARGLFENCLYQHGRVYRLAKRTGWNRHARRTKRRFVPKRK